MNNNDVNKCYIHTHTHKQVYDEYLIVILYFVTIKFLIETFN